MKNNLFKGFTLVELIIVITILSILSTISFLSFQNYTKSSRDTTRLGNLKNIETSLKIYGTTTQKFPIPADYAIISLSGINLSYQGKIGENITKLLKLNIIPKDPFTQESYIYSTDINQKGYKLMGYLESGEYVLNIFPQVYGADIIKNNPKVIGNGPGILTNTGNEIITGNTDLYLGGSGLIYKLLVGNGKEIIGSGQELGGTFQNLALNGYKGFGIPNNCPEGFIPIPGNQDFGQVGFCVAKYEMTYKNLTYNPSNSGWNSYGTGIENPSCTKVRNSANSGEACTSVDFLNQNGGIVSKPGYGIANLTQHESIQACKSIGAHLITNNEWMTIARNIESNSLNWSGGIVGTSLFNGISSNTTFGCVGTGYVDSEYGAPSTDKSCSRRIFKLTNGQEIWDFAGNLTEHVNKANTLDGSRYNLGLTQFDLTGNWAGTFQWHNTGWSSTGIQNDIRNKYGPTSSMYNYNNGIGNIYGWYNTLNNNIFLRGGNVYDNAYAGIFTLNLRWISTDYLPHLGFRCSY